VVEELVEQFLRAGQPVTQRAAQGQVVGQLVTQCPGHDTPPVAPSGHADAWRAEVDFATRFVAEAPSLDIAGDDPLNQHGSGGGLMSLREVLVGMIHEYARHMGHADLLRERIDGRIGQ
jgi:hypothetical protein